MCVGYLCDGDGVAVLGVEALACVHVDVAAAEGEHAAEQVLQFVEVFFHCPVREDFGPLQCLACVGYVDGACEGVVVGVLLPVSWCEAEAAEYACGMSSR